MGHNEYWLGPGDDGYVDAAELDAVHDPKPEDWGNEYDVCGVCGVPLTANGQHWPGYETDAQGGVWLPATSTAYDDGPVTASVEYPQTGKNLPIYSTHKTADYGTAFVTIEVEGDMPEGAAEWLVDQLLEAQNGVGTLFSDEAYDIFGITDVRIY